jgi:PPOX class probable F420-dependent enzyme
MVGALVPPLADPLARLAAARVAYLATASAAGVPHVVPIVLALDGERIVTAIDGKPKGPGRPRRLANIAENPRVAVLADRYDDADWSRLWWVRADGRARIVEQGPERERGLAALRARYVQYRGDVALDGALVVIEIDVVRGWAMR